MFAVAPPTPCQLKAFSHEFSFPSSHAGLAGALFTFVCCRDGTVGAGGLALAVSVCVSRVYEGVHYPQDVAAGASVGLAVALWYSHVLPYALQLGETALFASNEAKVAGLLCVPAVVLAAVLEAYRSAAKHTDPVEWSLVAFKRQQPSAKASAKASTKAAQAKPDAPSKQPMLATLAVPLGSYVGMVGVLIGLAVAEPYHTLVPLLLPSTAGASVLRTAVGMVLLLGLFFAVRSVEKMYTGLAALCLRALRYGQVPVIILIVAPALFNQLSL